MEERFRGSAGDDLIDGRGGTDLLEHWDSPAGVIVDLSQNEVTDDGFGNTDQVFNIENVFGTVFDDQLTGNSLSNFLGGAAGE